MKNLFKHAEKFTRDNSPMLLTAVGVTGVVTTAVLAHNAGIKANKLIESEVALRQETISRKEAVGLTWQIYIPAVSTGVVTCAAVIGANRIGTRRAAAMAAAYSVSERAFNEYREKVVEKLGVKKEQQARDEIAQERVNRNPVENQQVVVTSGGEVLCMDAHSGRYFQSDMESIKKAQNDLNYYLLNNFYASLNDFYDKLGLDRIKHGDEVGWNSDKQMELTFSTTMSNDDRPCIVIDFAVSPVRDYFRTH